MFSTDFWSLKNVDFLWVIFESKWTVMPQHAEIAHFDLLLKIHYFICKIEFMPKNVILPLNRVFQHKMLYLKGKKALHFVNLIEKLLILGCQHP